MSQFDVDHVALSGINLIEASAGTGKTHTLAELYCRLVIEQGLEVRNILVVTYTRAATEELRGRLRQRLVTERQRLSQSDNIETQREAIVRLTLAIQSFDEAAIYTIHGFCQRVLQDFAFESASPFEMSLLSDEQILKQTVADDFWRRQVATANAELAAYLLAKKQSPETLLAAVDALIGKPYLHFLPLPEIDVTELQQQFARQFVQLQQLWRDEREQVIAILSHPDLLNGNKYRKTSVPGWIIDMDRLLQGAPQPGLFDKFERFTRQAVEDALKKGKILPELAFWSASQTLFALDQQLQAGYELTLQQLRRQLAVYLQTELPKRKQQLQVQAFDDLLLNLQSALYGEAGNDFAARIRSQFQAALIDEFQDTDPVQYDCFHRIFADSGLPVFFVGDPKQAIYSFRGADIFTYLEAKKAARQTFTLDTNWRSHPLLVQAVNQLFVRIDNPFSYAAIPFVPVNAARDNQPGLTVDGQSRPPFEWLWLSVEKAPVNTGDMLQHAAELAANQIAESLNQAATGAAQLIDKNDRQRVLNGGDIAVLVRNHTQAVLMQKALKQRGVNSVQHARDSVFASEQAVMLEHVLLAVANPQHDSRLATALATPIFGKTALQIERLQQDETAWLQQSDFFVQLHETWQQQGFIVMFQLLIRQLNVRARWLQASDGERQLTNLLHLAELIQAQISRQHSTMSAVLSWLAAQRQTADTQHDAAQLRLESDEQLVKIITIHTSKGLEYPIVFCPFLWHAGQPRKKPVLTFHRDSDQQACVAFAEPALSEAEQLVAAESQAEDLRLLYVALTRARERCVVIWGPAKTAEQSALFSLLHPALQAVDSTAMVQDLQALTQAFPAQFSVRQVSDQQPVISVAQPAGDTVLQARSFTGEIARPWSVGSFSGLTQGYHDEQPDHDALPVLVELSDSPAERRRDRFSFPKGAQAGSCLHALFEHWDFQQNDSLWQQQIASTLTQFGIDADWSAVVQHWLQEVVNTPLDATGNLRLGALQAAQRLDEMAFYFSVTALTTTRLQAVLQDFAIEIPALAAVAHTLHFRDLTGFMKGFIDLIFEADSRFYIVDYKSNWLGEQFSAYHPQALEQAMVSHAYPLQYLIYSVALHRYLRQRLPDYDPARHFGGVYYLFIRGMHPAQGQNGIYHARPSAALLDALDACMTEVDDD